MTARFRMTVYVLAAVLALSPAAQSADQMTSLVRQADLDIAIEKTMRHEDSQRETIVALLHRDEVRSMAASYRLDLRPAEAAVRGIEGEGLQRLSHLAATTDAQLPGGDGPGEAAFWTFVGAGLFVLVALILIGLTGGVHID